MTLFILDYKWGKFYTTCSLDFFCMHLSHEQQAVHFLACKHFRIPDLRTDNGECIHEMRFLNQDTSLSVYLVVIDTIKFPRASSSTIVYYKQTKLSLSITIVTHSVVKQLVATMNQYIPSDWRPGLTSLSFLGVLALPLPLPLPLALRCSLSELPVELIPLDSRGSTLASVTVEETKGGWIAECMCDEQCSY